MAWYLILLASTPLLTLVLHALIVRLFQNIKFNLSPILVAAFSVLVGYGVMGWISWALILCHLHSLSEKCWAGVYGILVYSGLAFSYFQFFGMTETARRIRILTELHFKRVLSVTETTRWYDPRKMVAFRLERLVAWKQLTLIKGRYLLKNHALLCIAKVIETWSKILGFDQKVLS